MYIDDINKKLVLSKKGKFITCNYSDINDFELIQNGNYILAGREMETAIGGLLLGSAGAFLGSTGKRKSTQTCNSLLINIYLNSLNNPKLTINLLNSEAKMDGFIYKDSIEKASQIIGILKYIENNK